MLPNVSIQPAVKGPGPDKKPVSAKLRLVAAWLLCFGYFYMIPMEFSSLEWEKTGEGLWRATEGGAEPFFAVQILLWLMGTLLVSLLFLVTGVAGGFRYEKETVGNPLRGTDLAYYFAWIQVLTLASLFLLSPFSQDEGWIATFLPYLPHLFMVLLALFLFRGRLSSLGFRSLPVRSWLQIVFIVGAAYAFIYFLLDPLVTEPVARAFSLEMTSWREDSISQGLTEAAGSGWMFAAGQVLMIGMIGPVAEEILFRGVLMGVLAKRVGVAVAVILSSALFALSHVDVAFLAPLFVMGLIMGIMYAYFKNLWVPILFHIVNNTVSVILDLFQMNG
ncbi:CPBP family intramembrane glutamic endopeptidase [Kroppenstedtia sanguinis]|uniref:CPBP family intramembrane glutamic endopeptidase n=1 Tax=Kroppenstedtia sanguinis TaxID=1380684 RepID=A0ABW4CFC3_9BACL